MNTNVISSRGEAQGLGEPVVTTGRRSDANERAGMMKRYNLALPAELYDAVHRLAEERHVTVLELLRRFIKLGLLLAKIEDTPGAALIVREGGVDRQIVLV